MAPPQKGVGLHDLGCPGVLGGGLEGPWLVGSIGGSRPPCGRCLSSETPRECGGASDTKCLRAVLAVLPVRHSPSGGDGHLV